MLTEQKNTQAAPCAWWAAQDARMRSIANKSHWGPSVQLQVERMKMALGELYAGKIYDAYNKKRVSIKVDRPFVRDLKQLRSMEAYWAEQGVTKTITPQGVLYRVA
jgi:hypothetical protein